MRKQGLIGWRALGREVDAGSWGMEDMRATATTSCPGLVAVRSFLRASKKKETPGILCLQQPIVAIDLAHENIGDSWE